MAEAIPLSRFAPSSRMTAGAGDRFRLKYNAFMPRSIEDGPPSLSVFRIDGLTDEQVWELARVHILSRLRAGRRVHGRADIEADGVLAAKPLEVEFDDTPPRHANVVGWPREREQQMVLAQALANAARHMAHHLKESTPPP